MARAVFAFVLVTVMSCSLLAQNTAPQVTVWLYRPGVDNFGSAVPLYLDGRKLLNLGHGRFFGIPVSPGLHAFNWTNLPGARHVVVPVGPEAQAYFEVTFITASPFLSISPVPVDKAMQAMTGLLPPDPNGVFDSGVMIPAKPLQAAFKAPSIDAASIAKPTFVSVSTQQNLATASPVSLPRIASSSAVKTVEKTSTVEKTPKENPIRNLQTKVEKETIWVKAVTHGSNVEAAETPDHHKNPFSRPFMDRVQAENGQIYTISCSAHWIVSNCGPMVDGDSFRAEVEKKTMWITAHKDGNLWNDVRIRYAIVDVR